MMVIRTGLYWSYIKNSKLLFINFPTNTTEMISLARFFGSVEHEALTILHQLCDSFQMVDVLMQFCTINFDKSGQYVMDSFHVHVVATQGSRVNNRYTNYVGSEVLSCQLPQAFCVTIVFCRLRLESINPGLLIPYYLLNISC